MVYFQLIRDSSGRKKGKGVPCEYFKFRIGGKSPQDFYKKIPADCVLGQGVRERHKRFGCLHIAQYAQVGPGFVHDKDNVGGGIPQIPEPDSFLPSH